MNIVSEIISTSSLKFPRRKLHFDLNQSSQKQLSYFSISKNISVSSIIKYTNPELEKASPSKRIKTNSSASLDPHQLEVQKLAMELDRKRERFNRNTFFL